MGEYMENALDPQEVANTVKKLFNFWGIAMDKDGTWYAYEECPIIRSFCWGNETRMGTVAEYMVITAPINYTGSWENSRIEGKD